MKGKLASLLGTAIVIAACGGPAPSQGEAFCKGLCKAAERCGAQPEVCHQQCVEENTLSSLSIDAAGRLGDCTSGFDCATLQSDYAWKYAEKDCAEAAAVASPRTPKFRAFCAAYSQAWFDCNTVVSTAECEDDFVLYTDEVIDSLAQCLNLSSCDDLEPCVKKALGS